MGRRASSTGGGGAPSGAAGGSLAGNYPNPTIALAMAQNLTVGPGQFIGVQTAGPLIAASGLFRAGQSSVVLAALSMDGVTTLPLITTGASDLVTIGGNSNGGVTIKTPSDFQLLLNNSIAYEATVNGNYFSKPVQGNATAWGAINGTATGDATATGTGTEAAAAYQQGMIRYTQALTGNVTENYPTPTNANYDYTKIIINATSGAFTLTFKCGAGTTVAVAQGKSAILLFKSTGDVVRITPDT